MPPFVVRTPRDPSIERIGFTCYRLVAGVPVELEHSRNTMFAFVRQPRA